MRLLRAEFPHKRVRTDAVSQGKEGSEERGPQGVSSMPPNQESVSRKKMTNLLETGKGKETMPVGLCSKSRTLKTKQRSLQPTRSAKEGQEEPVRKLEKRVAYHLFLGLLLNGKKIKKTLHAEIRKGEK